MQHEIKIEVISTHALNSQAVKICAAPKSQDENVKSKVEAKKWLWCWVNDNNNNSEEFGAES